MFRDPGTVASCTPPTVSLLFSVTGIRSCPDFLRGFPAAFTPLVTHKSVDLLRHSVQTAVDANSTREQTHVYSFQIDPIGVMNYKEIRVLKRMRWGRSIFLFLLQSV